MHVLQLPYPRHLGELWIDRNHHGFSVDSFDQKGCLRSSSRRRYSSFRIVHPCRLLHRRTFSLPPIVILTPNSQSRLCRLTVLRLHQSIEKRKTHSSSPSLHTLSSVTSFNSRIDTTETFSLIEPVT